jgi:hypothetical protein
MVKVCSYRRNSRGDILDNNKSMLSRLWPAIGKLRCLGVVFFQGMALGQMFPERIATLFSSFIHRLDRR